MIGSSLGDVLQHRITASGNETSSTKTVITRNGPPFPVGLIKLALAHDPHEVLSDDSEENSDEVDLASE